MEWLYLPLCLLIGYGFIWLGYKLLIESHEAEQSTESKMHTAQQERSNAKQRILMQVGGPECKDGTYSPRQIALWREFDALDKTDKILKQKGM